MTGKLIVTRIAQFFVPGAIAALVFFGARSTIQTALKARLSISPSHRSLVASNQKPVVANFRLVNRGHQELNIMAVMGVCSCTVHIPGGNSIGPGQQKTLQVTVQPLGGPGLVHKSIRILTDEPDHNTHDITIDAQFPKLPGNAYAAST